MDILCVVLEKCSRMEIEMKKVGRQWFANGECIDGKKKQNAYICATMAFSFLVIVIVAFLKWQGTDINYRNSDATWHTLLTMQAYDETPVSVHKFVPIVTTGEERDKGIPWGATIPDDKGNYYYTSFSPMGYMIPYFFVKILHLPFSEKSLFCLNMLLLLMSCIVIILLFREIYGEKCNYLFLAIIMFCYIISPEIMHGMGIVYWHQSIMQIFIPLQCLLYYRYIKNEEDKISKVLFYLFCVINPYTEWSGFVANGGFFIAEFIRNCKKKGVKKIVPLFSIGICTIISFAIFCVHYLSVVSANDFFAALKNRFFARNIATTAPLQKLLVGYKESFAALLVIIGIFAVVWIYAKKSENGVKMEDKLLLFVSAFPVVENFIMKEHAISYTYDRMKLALPLMLILYWLLTHIQIETKAAKLMAVMVPIVCSIYLAIPYFLGNTYVWKIDYRVGNEKLCRYLNENYDNSVCGMDLFVRGYVNLTLGRGCYELVNNIYSMETTAEKEGRRYLVLLSSNGAKGADLWNLYYMDALVYDRENKEEIEIHNTGSDIEVNVKEEPTVFKLAKRTDSDWKSGVKADNNKVVIFDYHPALLKKIEKNKYIKANKKFYQIADYEYDYNWITVTVNQDATGLAYPRKIKFTDKKQ